MQQLVQLIFGCLPSLRRSLGCSTLKQKIDLRGNFLIGKSLFKLQQGIKIGSECPGQRSQ